MGSLFALYTWCRNRNALHRGWVARIKPEGCRVFREGEARASERGMGENRGIRMVRSVVVVDHCINSEVPLRLHSKNESIGLK